MPAAFPSWSTAPWQYPAASGHRLAPLWKAPDGQEYAASAGPLARDPQLAQLEAYLFATPEPLSIRRLTSLIKQATADDIKRQLKKLASLYDQQGSAWQLVELAGGYQLRTREAFLPWLLKLQPAATVHLSPAARETLAIVAYRQPINRADLEAIRGVSCMDVLRMLLEKNLIRIVGRDKTLGRPVQYGTTKQFLEMMGLKGLQELPPLKE